MRDEEYLIAVTEVFEVLKNFEEEDINKIPKSFMQFLENERLPNYKPNFDFSMKLEELPLRNSSKALLGLIYINYLANDIQKNDYSEILKNNLKKETESHTSRNSLESVLVQNKVENISEISLIENKKNNIVKKIFYNVKEFLKKLLKGGKNNG